MTVAGDTTSIVLVHGAWHGSWCWDLVAEGLSERGIRSEAVELPFTGFDADIAEVRSVVRSHAADGPVVLVGHSYGGLVITEAGHAASQLVYVAGLLPTAGERALDMMTTWMTPELLAAVEFGDDGVLRIGPEARDCFYHLSPPELAEAALGRLRPFPAVDDVAFEDPSWSHVPTTYVVSAFDRALHPEVQRDRSSRVSAAVELPADHSTFYSAPGTLVDVLAALC